MKSEIKDINKIVGCKLRLARIQNKVTRKDLAQALGMDASAIYNAEVGRIRVAVETVYKYSIYFNVPIDWFYNDVMCNESRIETDKSDIKSIAKIKPVLHVIKSGEQP